MVDMQWTTGFEFSLDINCMTVSFCAQSRVHIAEIFSVLLFMNLHTVQSVASVFMVITGWT